MLQHHIGQRTHEVSSAFVIAAILFILALVPPLRSFRGYFSIRSSDQGAEDTEETNRYREVAEHDRLSGNSHNEDTTKAERLFRDDDCEYCYSHDRRGRGEVCNENVRPVALERRYG